MMTMLQQTEQNLAILFRDPSEMSVEQSKALGVVNRMIHDRLNKEIEEWVRQRSDVQTPLSF